MVRTAVFLVRAVLTVSVKVTDPALSDATSRLTTLELIRPAAARPTYTHTAKNGKGSPYSTAERSVPELNAVLGSQPACDVSHKPDGKLPLLSARSAVTLATLKSAATNFAAL